MKTTFGNACLVLALVSLSMAAALSIGLDARHSGVTVQAYTASMQLQGSAETDEGSAAPDEEDKTPACAQRDCQTPKQELALVLAEVAQSHESKAFVAPGEQTQPKSKE